MSYAPMTASERESIMAGQVLETGRQMVKHSGATDGADALLVAITFEAWRRACKEAGMDMQIIYEALIKGG